MADITNLETWEIGAEWCLACATVAKPGDVACDRAIAAARSLRIKFGTVNTLALLARLSTALGGRDAGVETARAFLAGEHERCLDMDDTERRGGPLLAGSFQHGIHT